MNKVIHRIFFDFNDSGDPFLPLLETWKRELPDFQIMQWNKNNLPLDLNDFTRILTKEKNHAFLSDYFRCWLLEKYGGVYLDADIEVLDGEGFRKIYEETHSALDHSLFIGVESAANGKLTAHSMGLKGSTSHPILRFLMDLYETAFSGPLHYAIKKFDMPFLMSLYFIDLEKQSISSASENGCFRDIERPIIVDNIKIYPPSFFSPLTTRGDRMFVSSFGPETCLCHHFAATWRKESSTIKSAKLFVEALRDRDYMVKPGLVKRIQQRYPGLDFSPDKPKWELKPNQIQIIEKVLNMLIPYDSELYKLFKRKK